MIVYVLYHSDIEDDKYVRGVFESEELARGHITVHEPSAHLAANGGPRWSFRTHGDWCCYVDAWSVHTAPVGVYHGPEVPPDPNGPRLVPEAFVSDMLDFLRQRVRQPEA